jgi:hypothetical protein
VKQLTVIDTRRMAIERSNMSFEQAFADSLTSADVPVAVEDVPDRASLEADLESLATWLASLEADTREAIDEVTSENPIQVGLAAKSVAIVSTIGPVLAAFDAQPASISVSMALDMMKRAFDEAARRT